jgi:hypothetical protein
MASKPLDTSELGPIHVPLSDNPPLKPEQSEFRRQAYLAALIGIMASSKQWDLNGEPVDRLAGFVELAWRTADLSLDKS